MPDRLSELVRQRALVLEHLAWLDREIANASVQPVLPPVTPVTPPAASAGSPRPVVPATTVAPSATPPPPAPSPLNTKTGSEPDAILDQYRVEPATLKSDVRKGCFLYFSLAFVLLVVVVAILYFVIGSR